MGTRSLRKEHEKMAASHKDARCQFILTELELALTFCEIALSSNNTVRSARNIENARQAYKVAEYFLEDANFSEKVNANVQAKFATLEAMLQQVERHSRTFAASKSLDTR